MLGIWSLFVSCFLYLGIVRVAERTKVHVIWSYYTIELSYELTNAIQETSTFKSNANRLISTVARAGMLLLPKYSR